MEHKLLIVALAAAFLSGCTTITPNQPPVISDMQESVVKVQVKLGHTDLAHSPEEVDIDQVIAKATEGCEHYKKIPELIGERCAIYGDHHGFLLWDRYKHCIAQEYIFTCKQRTADE